MIRSLFAACGLLVATLPVCGQAASVHEVDRKTCDSGSSLKNSKNNLTSSDSAAPGHLLFARAERPHDLEVASNLPSPVPLPQSSCPATAPPVPFTVEYRAYIPYDNIQANNYPGCVLENGTIFALYLGDSPGSALPTGPPPTYRTSIYSVVTPNSAVPISFVTPDTGVTYQFSMPSSPVKPPFLSAADYDGIFYDCYRENLEGHAQYGINMNTYSVTSSVTANSVTATYSGQVGNPLSTPNLQIGWNFQTTITANPASRSATVTIKSGLLGGVTCFPAHEVLVDGTTVAYYIPANSTSAYIAACLAVPATFALTGAATLPGGVTLSY